MNRSELLNGEVQFVIMLGKAVFEGRTIPCISLEGQKVFHSGYDPEEKELHDIEILMQITKGMVKGINE
jgi:hypothetical protein